jgi:hypothetical protein
MDDYDGLWMDGSWQVEENPPEPREEKIVAWEDVDLYLADGWELSPEYVGENVEKVWRLA